jgi:hypothetical protein
VELPALRTAAHEDAVSRGQGRVGDAETMTRHYARLSNTTLLFVLRYVSTHRRRYPALLEDLRLEAFDRVLEAL